MAILQFDASRVAPDEGRGDPVPPGWYVAAMEKSEMKPTKDGVNMMLACSFAILDGQYKGRKFFFNFNLQHTNPQTVSIAYAQLSAVCHAVQLLQVNDSSELHGRPLKVKLKVRPAEGQYAAANDVEAFKHVQDPAANNQTAATMGAPGTPQAAVVAPPPVQQWAAPPAAAAAPAQQQWAPPPAQQQAQPPAAPPAAPGAWTPPPGQQPWASGQAAAPAQAPAAPPALPPGPPMQPAWQPPAAAAPGAPIAPPWQTAPPAA